MSEGWGCSLVVEHLPVVCKGLSSIPSTRKRQERRRERTGNRELGKSIPAIPLVPVGDMRGDELYVTP